MNKYDNLYWIWRFFRRFMICVWIDIFRVLVGLLSMMNFGFSVIVCVIVICWCWLLENLCGNLFWLLFFKLILFSVVEMRVFCFVWLLGKRLWRCSFLEIMELIDMWGLSDLKGFWKMICKFCFKGCICLFVRLLRLVELKWIVFVFDRSCNRVRFKVVLLELDLLIILSVFFDCNCREILFIVCIWFIVWCRILCLIGNYICNLFVEIIFVVWVGIVWGLFLGVVCKRCCV